MAICNLSDLSTLLTSGQCLMGLDYGQVVIGVAVSDPARRVASPLMGLKRGKFADDVAALLKVIEKRNIGGIIMGLPKTMEGTEGPMAQAARTFASKLLRVQPLPLVFWDERFSTAAVTRMMIADDMTRKRRAETVDKAAAAYILQGAVDALQRSAP